MCCSLAVHWVNPGGNQWVWSSGCGLERISGYSQNESAEHKGSHRCGLEGTVGVVSWGSVGVVWRKTVCVPETTIGCSTAGITRCSWKGTVGVVWRGSLGAFQ